MNKIKQFLKGIDKFINQSGIRWQDRETTNRLMIIMWTVATLLNLAEFLPVNHLNSYGVGATIVNTMFVLFMVLLQFNNRFGVKASSLHRYTSLYVKQADLFANMDVLISSEEVWLKTHNSLDDLALYKQHEQNRAVLVAFKKNLATVPTVRKWND